MRLPSLSQFKSQMQSLTRQQQNIDALQKQASSWQKIQRASEDPLLANRIQSMEDYLTGLEGYTENGRLAQSRATLVDSTIQSSIGKINRAQELLQQAQSGSMAPADRRVVAEELKGLVDQLYILTNTRDSNGDYIFSGTAAKSPSFVKGDNGYEYKGSQERLSLTIARGNTVVYGESGLHLFGNMKVGNGSFEVLAHPDTNTGSGVASPGKVLNHAEYVADVYEIRMVTNAEGKLAYEVTGQNSGQVIPPPPQTSPDNAPAYVERGDIVFHGLSLQIEGMPALGDTFTLRPAGTQNMLNTLMQVAESLDAETDTPKQKADLLQELSGFAASLTEVNEYLRTRLSEHGARAKNIDEQVLTNDTLLKDGRIDQKVLREIDPMQVISQMKQSMVTLEITQQSYMKMQEVFYAILNQRQR